MKKYKVEVWVTQVETWEVRADNEEDARKNYNDGYEKFCTVEESSIENVEEINDNT